MNDSWDSKDCAGEEPRILAKHHTLARYHPVWFFPPLATTLMQRNLLKLGQVTSITRARGAAIHFLDVKQLLQLSLQPVAVSSMSLRFVA